MSAAKITVHWLENSRAQRILWLLEELELPYEIKKYLRDPKTFAPPPELSEVHPLGKSPVVTIEEDGETVTLAESGAIVEYLIERFGNGKLAVPAIGKPRERADYLYYLHYAEGTMMTPRMFHIVLNKIPKQVPEQHKPVVQGVASQTMDGFVRPRFKQNYDLVEQALSEKEYFAGDSLTGADIMMVYPIQVLDSALGYENYPRCKAWLDRIVERPAYKRAEAKGGANKPEAFVS